MFAYRPKAMEFTFYAILILLLHAVNFFTLLKVIAGGEHQKKVAENIKKTCWRSWKRENVYVKWAVRLLSLACSCSSDISLNLRFFEKKKKILLSFQFLYSTMTTVMEHEEEENDEKKIKIQSHKDY